MKPRLYMLFLALATAASISCSNLKRNEVAKVTYEMYGCFGSEQSQLIIYKEKGTYKAVLVTKGAENNEAAINDEELSSLQSFVTELKSTEKPDPCTTVQFCTVYTQNEKVVKKQIGCDWNGFYILKNALFGTSTEIASE